MKAITAIYNAPIVINNSEQIRFINNSEQLYSCIGIKYSGKIFKGYAFCHPEDQDFQSEKIGKNIALMRARINALQYEYSKTKIEAQIKKQMYLELGTNSNCAILKNMEKAIYRAEMLRKELKSLKQDLKDYLNSQQDFINKILKTRTGANSDKKS